MKEIGDPGQEGPLVKVGVTLIIPDIWEVPEFVAVKVGIPVAFPKLLAANPILVLLLVQV